MRLVLDREARWRWFRSPLGVEVELYSPTTVERERLTKCVGTRELMEYVARHWFRDFRNITDPEGNPIENSADMRFKILDGAPDLAEWIFEQLRKAEEWRAEGNDDAASG